MEALLQNTTFWVAVSLVVFLVIAYKPAKKAFLASVDGKIDEVKAEVEQAAKLRDEAQALLAEYERKQQQSAAHAEEMIAAAKREAEESKTLAEEELRISLERQQKLAEERIALAEEKAIREVRAAATDLAIAATEKLITERAAGPDGDRLVDQAIAGLSTKLQ